jgi:NDP-sugar pyrophosphorylase family protein
MKAMILAAGFGTRLRPLTDQLPKALIPLSGMPLLQIVLENLSQIGCAEVAVNVHHYAEQIIDYLNCHSWPHMKVLVSYEEQLLDTGGGLVRMMRLLDPQEPVLVHNVDVLTNLNMIELLQYHHQRQAMVTLVVQKRMSKRLLLFDEKMQLMGRAHGQSDLPDDGRSCCYAFNGIQVLNPTAFQAAPPPPFSSIDHFIHLADHGQKVVGFAMDRGYWRDLGKPDDLLQAHEDIRCGKIVLPAHQRA